MSDSPESSQPALERLETTTTAESSDRSIDASLSSSPPNFGNQAPVERSQVKPGTSSGSRRKRQVPTSVTPNACTNCKKARTKCDGAKPSCQRCVNRNTPDTCHYQIHAKTAREEMIREIQHLQRKSSHLEYEKEHLGEKNSWIEKIMRSLKEDGQNGEIISRLKRGESHQSIAEWLGRPLIEPDGLRGLSQTSEDQISQEIQQYHKQLVDDRDPRYWTNVTSNRVLIEHLITLYFTWIHPVHMLFDERHFLSSFKECTDVYCSSALVSVICTVSCHLLHKIDETGGLTKAAVDTLRDRFMQETLKRMRNMVHTKMTTIQTYAIMALADFASGHGLIASSHLRLAVEILTDKWNPQQDEEAQRVTIWGTMTLHTAWSGIIYQKPHSSIISPDHPFPDRVLKHQHDPWRLYKQPDDLEIPERAGYASMTAAEHSKLFRIVHEAILVYCGSRGIVTAHHILDLYKGYLMWRDELPSEIRDIDHEPLPHVIFLHIQYHTAIVQLLQPILHMDYMDRESYGQLQGLVIQHATAGLQLLLEYRNVHSYFYLSPFQLVYLVQLCDAVLRYDAAGETTPQTIYFCLTALEDAKVGYPVACALEKMFRNSLAEYDIEVPAEVEASVTRSDYLTPEELLDACTRQTYRQPISQILPNVQEDTGREFMQHWRHKLSQARVPEEQARVKAATKTDQERLKIDSLLNP
ncbi:hypothetical protein ACLMJK_003227 [Lecanora helva]